MYTPLYVKSNYSFMSSLVKIDEFVDSLISFNIKSVALCDDNMIATMYFYKKCKEKGIKPIIGYELKIDKFKVLLYAKNFSGYQNLLKIVTMKDEITFEKLEKYTNNLILIVPYEQKEIYEKLKVFFVNSYVGIKNNEEEYNALKITDSLVFLNKILYLRKSENKYFKYSIMMKDKKNVLDDVKYDDDKNYLMKDVEILTFCKEKYLKTSNNIAELCNVEFPKFDNLIPVFENNFGVSSSDYLTKLSIEGLKIRLSENVNDTYKKRLLYELDVIKKMGFADYFLIVYD